MTPAAIVGGRIIANWPGLSRGALYEGRDLKATTALAEHYALDPARLAAALFPKMAAANRPPSGLIRT
jgi:uncharacterized protein (DUF1501 family)